MPIYTFEGHVAPGYVNSKIIIQAKDIEECVEIAKDLAIKGLEYFQPQSAEVIGEMSHPTNWTKLEGPVLYACDGDY